MSRTVSQTLLDAISNQQGETILRVKTWATLAAYNAAPTVPERTWLTNKFKIEATEAEAALITDNDYTLSDFTVFIIERGATLAGVEYVVQSGIYFVSSFTETDGRLKITGSSFPDQKIIIAGDDTYENVITAFCTEIGKTATFKDTGAAWLDYQFLPAGKQVILNKAERFLNLIRQKYLILCYERGPKELVFYHATTEQSVWKDIIFADSQLILSAASGSHEIARSTDGLAYTKIEAPSFTNSIAYSPTLDLFAAVGNGVCMTSPDGVTWTSRTIGSNNWTGITWDSINGRFVAISDEALFVVISGTTLPYTAISTDGVSWTTYSYGPPNRTNTYQSIAYGNSMYAIVGNSSNCSSSTDGSAWSNRTIPAGDYKKLIYADGLFVAVGASVCATSTDGITWTERTIPTGTYTGLAYSSTLDLFVAIGDNLLATSPDGITWTSRTAPADQAWVAVAWADALSAFFAVSSDGDNRIASSTDGINWQILTTQADYSFSYLDGPASSIQHGTNTVHFISRDETASVNTSGDTDYPAWNLGYLESTDSAPGTNSDPFYKFFLQKAPLRLDVTDGDRVHFEPSWVLDPTQAIDAMIQIVEAFDSTKSPAWYQEIRSLALFDSVEGGSLPSTIERVAAYTPLVSSGFDGNLTPQVNNLQAFAEAVDDLSIAAGPATTAVNDFQVGDGLGAWVKKTLAQTITILGIFADAASDSIYYARRNAGWTNLKTYTDTLYAVTAKGVTNGDSHDHNGGDGAQISHANLSNIGATTHSNLDSIIETLIVGCQGIWNSVTSLSVGVGNCKAENGDFINITSVLTASSLSLSTNTEYHIYAYLSGGSPAMEVSTTAPVLWKGTAYSKTGDTSRRYMYSIRTATASGNVRKFVHNWVTNKIFYAADTMAATPYRVLSNGKATTSTAISLSGIVPVTTVAGFARFANVDSSLVCNIGVDAVTSTSYDNYFNAGLRATLEFAVASQNIYYFYDGGTPTNGLYIDILGYTFKR